MAEPTPTVKQATDSVKKKFTQESKDSALLRETYVLPLRVFFVTAVADPADATERTPCQLWIADEIKRIIAVAKPVVAKLGITLEVLTLTGITVPTLKHILFHENEDFAGQHRQFDTIVGHGAKNAQFQFDPRETYALFLGKVYRDDPKKSAARGFSLDHTDRKRSWEIGGNKLVIGYLGSAQKMPEKRYDQTCTITGGRLPDAEAAGVVLAHEIGHSLHLRHLEDEPVDIAPGRAGVNLMQKDVDLNIGEEGAAKRRSSLDFSVAPFQVEAALRYGRCAGRFQNAALHPEDDCPVLFQELGLQ